MEDNRAACGGREAAGAHWRSKGKRARVDAGAWAGGGKGRPGRCRLRAWAEPVGVPGLQVELEMQSRRAERRREPGEVATLRVARVFLTRAHGPPQGSGRLLLAHTSSRSSRVAERMALGTAPRNLCCVSTALLS